MSVFFYVKFLAHLVHFGFLTVALAFFLAMIAYEGPGKGEDGNKQQYAAHRSRYECPETVIAIS